MKKAFARKLVAKRGSAYAARPRVRTCTSSVSLRCSPNLTRAADELLRFAAGRPDEHPVAGLNSLDGGGGGGELVGMTFLPLGGHWGYSEGRGRRIKAKG